MFFTFPEDARWNEERDTVEFSVILGPYEGTVRVPRRSFQGLLDRSPTPKRCMEAFHLQRTRFELIVELKIPAGSDDGNVEITGRDPQERTPPADQGTFFISAPENQSRTRLPWHTWVDRSERGPRHHQRPCDVDRLGLVRQGQRQNFRSE